MQSEYDRDIAFAYTKCLETEFFMNHPTSFFLDIPKQDRIASIIIIEVEVLSRK